MNSYSSTLEYEEHQQQLDDSSLGAVVASPKEESVSITQAGGEVGEAFAETRSDADEVATVEWTEIDLPSDIVAVQEDSAMSATATTPRLHYVTQDIPIEFEEEEDTEFQDEATITAVGDEEGEGVNFVPDLTEPDEEIPPPLPVSEIEKIDAAEESSSGTPAAVAAIGAEVMTADEEVMEISEELSSTIQEKSNNSATNTLAMRAKSIGSAIFELEDETPASVTVTLTAPNIGTAVFEYEEDSSAGTFVSETSSVFEFEDEATVAASDISIGSSVFEFEDEEDMT